jgi:hypothetical protein
MGKEYLMNLPDLLNTKLKKVSEWDGKDAQPAPETDDL